MQKILLSFIVLIGVISISPANASSIATITELQSPVWVQQNNTKTELGQNSALKTGNQIITGDSGRVELILWSSVELQLNANSEITIGIQPELYIRKGRACIKFVSRPDTEIKFKLNIGNTMFAAMQHQGEICVLRQDGRSSIMLRSGSVQVTHSVDPNIIVLSEAGTEFRINDNGSYKLLFPGSDGSLTPEIETLVTVEATIEAESPSDALDVDDGEIVASEEVIKAETRLTKQEDLSDYIYTVYLFSTRDEDVAEEVNRKFQEAGHDTRIYVSETDSVTRYRIAVPGFKSAKNAEEFSNSIVGKLGIRETWIGKERQSSFRVGEEESNKLLIPGSNESSTPEIDNPVTTGATIGEENASDVHDGDDGNIVASEEVTKAGAGATTQEDLAAYNYTVYLFSTRSEDVAEQVNEKLQEAGHDTQIYVSETDSVTRYRIVVPGFKSAKTAEEFSNSIVGKLGIRETWIGKEQQKN